MWLRELLVRREMWLREKGALACEERDVGPWSGARSAHVVEGVACEERNVGEGEGGTCL